MIVNLFWNNSTIWVRSPAHEKKPPFTIVVNLRLSQFVRNPSILIPCRDLPTIVLRAFIRVRYIDCHIADVQQPAFVTIAPIVNEFG